MKKIKNTDPRFFALWSIGDLQKECARLNQVLSDCLDTLQEMDTALNANFRETYENKTKERRK